MKPAIVVVAAMFAALSARADQPAAPAAPEGQSGHHGDHHAGVDERGDQGMGFSHQKTNHHFALTTTGGIISADAKSGKDTASRDGIRRHFVRIASAFKQGDFDGPMHIHGKVPAGVPTLQRLKDQIDYEMTRTPLGGRVTITTRNPEALQAIHELMRFQIAEHRTGDSIDVQP